MATRASSRPGQALGGFAAQDPSSLAPAFDQENNLIDWINLIVAWPPNHGVMMFSCSPLEATAERRGDQQNGPLRVSECRDNLDVRLRSLSGPNTAPPLSPQVSSWFASTFQDFHWKEVGWSELHKWSPSPRWHRRDRLEGFAGHIGAALTRQDISTILQCGTSRRGRTKSARGDQ